MTVNEVSKLTGITVRTLQYYDRIGLLCPTEKTQAGYRLYDDAALEKLQQILLFRELKFPLKEINDIVNSPNFDRSRALDQQIELLTLRKEHLENLIAFARGIKMLGVKRMDFSVFDTKKIDEYAKRAKEQYGQSKEYKEYEEKAKNRSAEEEKMAADNFMHLFVEFGAMKEIEPGSDMAQKQVEKLKNYINEYFYQCTNEILFSLGQMYSGGGEFTESIDKTGGEGTAEFASEAIRIYCGK